MTIVVMFPTTPQTNAATMNYTAVVLGGSLALSLVYYYFPKYGGVHWFVGPISTLPRADERDLRQGGEKAEEVIVDEKLASD